ncbi:MAG: glycosyltransferase family 39 protein, partial [Gemmatimonadota bacterium]
FAQAKMLAAEGHTYQEIDSPLQFLGAHWLDAGDGRYFSKYPPGLPLILSLPYGLLGPTAALWVDPLLASLALIALFLIGRQWMGSGWGLVAVALMAVNPSANGNALGGFAHTAVAAVLLWGIYFLIRWHRTGAPGWAAAAGLCVGFIPAIRYAEVLFAGAFALFALLVLSVREGERAGWTSAVRRRGGLALFGGVLLPVTALAIRNQLAFGAFWRTGYAISGEQTGFGWSFLSDHWLAYLEALMGSGVGLLFGLGIVGLAVLCDRSETREAGILLTALIVPSTLLYMAYYYQPSPRFLLPTFYLYVLTGVWLLQLLSDALGRPARVATVAVVTLTAFWGIPLSVRAMSRVEQQRAGLTEVTKVVEEHVGNGAILLADNAVGQHLDFLGRWRVGHLEALIMSRRLSAQFSGDTPDPTGAGMNRFGAVDRFGRYAAGSREARTGAVRADLEEWVGSSGKVYLLGSQSELADWSQQLSSGHDVLELAVIELPVPDVAAAGPLGGARPLRNAQQLRAAGTRGAVGRLRRMPGAIARAGLFTAGTEPLALMEWSWR